MKLFQRVLFSRNDVPIYAEVHAVMLSKKHRRSSTVQEDGVTNEGRHHLLFILHEQAHDKRGIAEPLHVYINIAASEVGVFSSEISQFLKIPHPPL